jgi:hypothetical protein
MNKKTKRPISRSQSSAQGHQKFTSNLVQEAI